MPMDEVVRAIERIDSEDIQDILDAFVARYDELHPDRFLVVVSLPRNDSAQWEQTLKQAIQILHRCED